MKVEIRADEPGRCGNMLGACLQLQSDLHHHVRCSPSPSPRLRRPLCRRQECSSSSLSPAAPQEVKAARKTQGHRRRGPRHSRRSRLSQPRRSQPDVCLIHFSPFYPLYFPRNAQPSSPRNAPQLGPRSLSQDSAVDKSKKPNKKGSKHADVIDRLDYTGVGPSTSSRCRRRRRCAVI